MINYPDTFLPLVEGSHAKSNIFYSNNSERECNPFYIGFGDPGAKILIIGQEKAIAQSEVETLRVESKENPYQWREMVTKKITNTSHQFPNEVKFLNPSNPYQDRAKGKGSGQTWYYYQQMVQQIYPELEYNFSGNTFFQKVFISELNYKTSRKKVGYQPHAAREEMWKADFFRNFPVVILATGDYIGSKKIEELFSVRMEADLSSPYSKLVVYKSSSRILIHTRQFSNGISKKLLSEISGLILKEKYH